MHIHPTLSWQLAHERQREMLAQASRLRLARRFLGGKGWRSGLLR